MLAGTKSYEHVNSKVSLRVESQRATNFISESLMDCNYGICYNNSENVLYIINKKEDESYTADIFKITDNDINYGTTTDIKINSHSKATVVYEANDNLVSHLFSSASFHLSYDENDAGEEISKVDFTLTLSARSNELTVNKTVALRNSPILLDVNTPK